MAKLGDVLSFENPLGGGGKHKLTSVGSLWGLFLGAVVIAVLMGLAAPVAAIVSGKINGFIPSRQAPTAAPAAGGAGMATFGV